jgi:predicted peptidase
MVNIILLLLISVACYQQPTLILKELKLKLDDGTELRYTSLSPSKIPKNQKIPLVVALHWGWDREKPLPNWFGKEFLTGIVQPAFENICPVIIAPDCPSDSWANPVSESAVLSLIDAIMKKYPVDSSRIFITGYSAGGIGTWYISSRHQDLFSLAIPMASRCEKEWLNNWQDLPVYVIHATDDELFPFTDTENIVNELTAKNVRVKLIKVENAAHSDSRKFIVPLQYSYKWLSELNLQ